MNKLYIIGNGFDCYAHGLKTKYSDFREYIVKKYNLTKEDMNIPAMPVVNATPEKNDLRYQEIIKRIVNLLDCCEGEKWSDIEKTIGSEPFFDQLWDREIMDAYTYIEDHPHLPMVLNNVSDSLTRALPLLRSLFNEWVNEALTAIQYHKIQTRDSFSDVLDTKNASKNIYINFNYTYTLERAYGIPKESVYHLHGSAEDNINSIIFGHSNSKIIEMDKETVDNAMNKIRLSLFKDTSRVIAENRSLFDQLYCVSEIYSFGFSFSDVDMPYIHEFAKSIDPTNVLWYFNSFDWKNNQKHVEKIKALGYKVTQEKRW